MWKCPLLLTVAFASGCTGDVQDSDADAIAPIPLDGTYEGQTFESWTATWWQWAFELPRTGHPLFDATGADCGNGQTGTVWFLGGTFEGDSATRDCVIPADQSLFFPVVNAVWDNGGIPPEDQMTDAAMQDALGEWMDGAEDLSVALDGELVADVAGYRLGPVQFAYTLPQSDSLYDYWGMPGLDGTTIDPSFSEGYWMMFAPLPAGDHDLSFTATLIGDPADPSDDFTIDTTYQLTVE
jgi:hypothetical protein